MSPPDRKSAPNVQAEQPARVALVTGAARRVGRAVALALAQAGCDVIVHHHRSTTHAREVAARIRDMGRRAECLAADLTAPPAVRDLFLQVDAWFGRLDVLVNNAAVFRRTPFQALDESAFDFHMNANLKAPYLCCLEAGRRMQAAGSGAIVNVTDVAAERPFKNHVPYCVSKAGLVMLTRGLAKALAPDVRVNAVGPGTVLFRDDEDDAARRAVIARIPMGRIGRPEDVAAAVRFLALEAPHTTGQVLLVDGGRSLD